MRCGTAWNCRSCATATVSERGRGTEDMEELQELRTLLEQRRYDEALLLATELEEMSKEDKVNKIRSFAIVLLLHLIKQAAEQRTTRSWELSIYHALYQIHYTNQRRKSSGTYLDEAALRTVIGEAYRPALKRAALEAFEGQYDEHTLAQKVDRAAIENEALTRMVSYRGDEE